MANILLTGAQVLELGRAIGSHDDGEQVTLYQQSDNSLVAGFSLTTITIAEDGRTEQT